MTCTMPKSTKYIITQKIVKCKKKSYRAPDKVHISISIMPISSSNPMFDHLLESSHRDDSNKWSNIGFGEEITKVEWIEVHFTHLIWSPEYF